MIIVDDKSPLPALSSPYCLTVGSYDGIHLGHQKLIERMHQVSGPSGTVAAFTFRNHPSELFNHGTSVPLISPLSQKLELLEEAGVDLVFLTDFNASLASLPYHSFLASVRERFPFSTLVLGKGSTFGKGREGTEDKIKDLANTSEFQVEYVPKWTIGDKEVSSRQIRLFIQNGDLENASCFLGRPYSLRLQFPDRLKGKCYLLPMSGICLPPSNQYPIELLCDDRRIIAHMDVHQKEQQLFIPLDDPSLAGKKIEITFIPKNRRSNLYGTRSNPLS